MRNGARELRQYYSAKRFFRYDQTNQSGIRFGIAGDNVYGQLHLGLIDYNPGNLHFAVSALWHSHA
jgi:hypothetical protein